MGCIHAVPEDDEMKIPLQTKKTALHIQTKTETKTEPKTMQKRDQVCVETTRKLQNAFLTEAVRIYDEEYKRQCEIICTELDDELIHPGFAKMITRNLDSKFLSIDPVYKDNYEMVVALFGRLETFIQETYVGYEISFSHHNHTNPNVKTTVIISW